MGGNESVEVTAGIWGFLVLFGLALACWFLFRSMNNHIRNVNFTEREHSRLGGGETAASDGVDARAGERGASASGGAQRVLPGDDDPIGGARH